MAISRLEHSHGDYERLASALERFGGTLRLARFDGGWGMTATVPAVRAEHLPRAIGFVLREIRELDTHARVALAWLDAQREIDEREVNGRGWP
jgi:hypothetical protein